MTLRTLRAEKRPAGCTQANAIQIDDTTSQPDLMRMTQYGTKADGSEECIVEIRRKFTRPNSAAAWTEVSF